MDFLRDAAEELCPFPLTPRGWITGTAKRLAIGLSTESEPSAGGSFWEGDAVVENNSIRKYLPNSMKWLDQSSTHLAKAAIDSSDLQTIQEAQAHGLNLGDVHVRGFSEIEIGGDNAHAATANLARVKSQIREYRAAQDWRTRDLENASGARSLQSCVGLAEE